MRKNRFILLLGAAAAFFYGEATLNAAAPAAPAASKEYLQQDFYRDILAAFKMDLGETYRSSGRHDPRWDVQAQAALELLADFDAQVATEDIAQPGVVLVPDVKEEDLGAAAQKAIDAGCGDPMVLYARALSLAATGNNTASTPFLERAAAAIDGSRYPAGERLRILKRQFAGLILAAQRAAAWTQIEACCRQLASDQFLNVAARREAAMRFRQALALAEPTDAEKALQRLSTAGVDPWFLELTRAWMESDAAWNAELQSTLEVAREADGHSDQHRAAAASHAEKAYELHPGTPEGAGLLVGIAAHAGDLPAAEKWFTRATAAQSDYAPAYDDYCTALAGTGEEAVLARAARFAADGRFDTAIPWEYLRAVRSLANPYGGSDIFSRPEIEHTEESIIGKYIAQWKGTPAERYFQTCLAAFDCKQKKYDQARQALDLVEGPVDREPFSLFQLSAPAAVEDIYLNTFEDRQGVARFRQAANRSNYDNASRFLQQVITRNHPAGRALEVIQREQACAQLMSAYVAGQRLSLNEETSRPFWLPETPYTIDQGAIVTDGREFSLRSHYYLNDRHYHLHLDFEFQDVHNMKAKFFNVAWGLGDNRIGWSMALTADPPRVDVQAPISEQMDNLVHVPLGEVPVRNVIDIQYFDGDPVLTVNGREIPLRSPAPQALEKLPAKNTLTVRSTAPVRITELTLQHLAARPVEVHPVRAAPPIPTDSH